MLSPFKYDAQIPPMHKFKMVVLTLILLPFRAIATAVSFGSVLIMANVLSRNFQINSEHPQDGKIMQYFFPILILICRLCFFCGGFQWIRVRGKRAYRNQAPILVVAPHSSFFDSLVVVYLGMPSVVTVNTYAESTMAGIFRVLQPLIVNKHDSDSRRNTGLQICSRAHSLRNWPQIVIFPEGTCTNRSALITFKPGAFQPGLPVQPIVIRWPNTVDCVTWVCEGPSVLKLLWMTLTQFHTCLEIEFLPVYTPNEEEKSDPQLFANNVRRVMASCLQVPTCDLSYDDFCRISCANECGLIEPEALVHTERLVQHLFPTAAGLPHTKSATVAEAGGGSHFWGRLEELLSLVREHPRVSRLKFVDALYPNSQPDKQVMRLINLVMEQYEIKEEYMVDIRRFLSRLCMFLFASDPNLALHYAVMAYPQVDHWRPSHPTNSPQCDVTSSKTSGSSSSASSWKISISDAADLLCGLYSFDRSRIMGMLAAYRDSSALQCKSDLVEAKESQSMHECLGASAGNLHDLLSQQASDLLDSYGQYVSRVRQLKTYRSAMSPSSSYVSLCSDEEAPPEACVAKSVVTSDVVSSTMVSRRQRSSGTKESL